MYEGLIDDAAIKGNAQSKAFLAPLNGWIRNEALSSPKAGGAEVLDNFFPTPEGARLRRGSSLHATCLASSPVTHLAVYDAGGASKMFATDDDKIYDASAPVVPATPIVASVSGMTSGDWTSFQVATTGGEYLLMFNGHDLHRVYDGATWAANSPAITGITSSLVSHGCKWKSFVWLIEAGTMDAWYLPTGAIGGLASVFPLGGVFSNGGALMMALTYSQDSGDGLDDYLLFVTTEGEIAVYQGTNAASDMEIVGVYKIGRPVGKNAWVRSGGDIMITTDDGIIPISSAVQLDRTGLMSAAVTYRIEDAWRLAINERSGTDVPFSLALWHSETMLYVGLPTFDALQPYSYVMNSRTGKWCRFSGQNVRCLAVFEDKLYFGTPSGTVVEAEVTGADQGVNYVGVWVPKFETFGRLEIKTAIAARIVARTNYTFTPLISACENYEVVLPVALSADPDDAGDAWDTGIWDTSVWGAATDQKASLSEWQDVAATGEALAPVLQLTSGRVRAPDIEIIRMDLQYEAGGMMVDG